MLRKNNIKFGVIMTLSKNNIDKEKEIYNFIKENNIYCNIRPAFPTNQNIDNNILMSNDEYSEFFIKMFNIWYYDTSNKVKLKQINEIYEEFIKILEPKMYKGSCENSINCFGNFVVLDTKGNVYTCNRTYNEKEFFLGNLNETSLENIINKCDELCIRRKNEIESSQCIKCEIFKFCHGGCPANSYYLYNDFIKPFLYSCKQKKDIYAYIKQKLEAEGQVLEYNNGKQRGNI